MEETKNTKTDPKAKKQVETEEIQVIKLPDNITPQVINAWKEKYGEKRVKIAVLSDDEDVFPPFEVVIRRPGRRDMGMYEKFMDRDPDKAKAIIVKNCSLTHTDELLSHDDKFAHAFNAIANLMPIAKAEIKNV